jgi:signal transduction histidine kinase
VRSRRTVRLRLTQLYSALFLVSGGTLLAITYLLTRGQIVRGPFPGDAAPQPGLHQGHQPPQAGRLLLLAGLALAVGVVVSVALGWLMAGRVLHPLRTIIATTRRISETNLHERLAVAGPDDEMKDLADTIDGLLTRLDTAFDSQRDALAAQQRFVANASHELRGPLTLERAALEIALADPHATVASLRTTCARVLASSRQQERLIDALLILARGQRGLDRHERFDLAAITDEVILARRNQIDSARLHLRTALSAAPADGDAQLAERLVGNLVDNAIRHNLPAGEIDISTSTRTGRAVLRVANTGPTVPLSETDRLLQPFQRLTDDRATVKAWACPSWPPSPPPTTPN